MAPELAIEDDENCPEEDCSNELYHRDHGSPTNARAEGPVKELVCSIHGVVASV